MASIKFSASNLSLNVLTLYILSIAYLRDLVNNLQNLPTYWAQKLFF